MYTTYKKLNWIEIEAKLANARRPTYFSQEAKEDINIAFDEVENSAMFADINIGVDLAYEAIQQGKDLTDTLAAAQIESCS
jgi:hypothetical protein